MENPEAYTVKINGHPIKYVDSGWWRDISFKKIPIGHVREAG